MRENFIHQTFGYVRNAPKLTRPADIVRVGSICEIKAGFSIFYEVLAKCKNLPSKRKETAHQRYNTDYNSERKNLQQLQRMVLEIVG